MAIARCNIASGSASTGRHSLNSLKGGLYRGLLWGTTIMVIKGDTRSLDNGSLVASFFRFEG